MEWVNQGRACEAWCLPGPPGPKAPSVPGRIDWVAERSRQPVPFLQTVSSPLAVASRSRRSAPLQLSPGTYSPDVRG
jgi:hypothetical protein